MLKLYDNGIYLVHGETICSCPEEAAQKSGITTTKEEATKGTTAYGILKAHNQSDDMDQLRLKFDSMTSHDITLCRHHPDRPRASGMKQFPLPYVLTNCHNSLCAVGGTINEDDHKFAPPLPTSTAASTFPPTWQTSTATTVRPWQAAEDDLVRLPHPLRRSGYHGCRRGRRRAGKAAGGPHLRFCLSAGHGHLSDRQALRRHRPPRRGPEHRWCCSTRTATSRTRSWSSSAPAWQICPSSSATPSTS